MASLLSRRFLGSWWRQQPPDKQDRFLAFGPIASVGLFLMAMILAFWYLRTEDNARQTENLRRDTEATQQQIRLRMIENQEQLIRLARDVVTRSINKEEFLTHANSFTLERPEITSLVWVNAKGERLATQYGSHYFSGIAPDLEEPAAADLLSEKTPEVVRNAFAKARAMRQPLYSSPYKNAQGNPALQLLIPLLDRNGFTGALVAEYSAESLLRYFVPLNVSRQYTMSLIDAQDTVLASTVSQMVGQTVAASPLEHITIVTSMPNGLLLKGQGFKMVMSLVNHTLFGLVAVLSALTLWTLIATWSHMRRRSEMQQTLVSETNFRRAMENSVLTGMRAMDRRGRITYVNPAFCTMTGFRDEDLIGKTPPYPHWPPSRVEENMRLLQLQLQGRCPVGGIEVKVLRKDGAEFDARMYVSPLIDAQSQQSGWMTSMTNITEAKRIRDQLSASHERFTTVLEGLDAAVSVLSVEKKELLFANRSYRVWFGIDPQYHVQLTGLPAQIPESDPPDIAPALLTSLVKESTQHETDSHEVFMESLQKWFDVRSRFLLWTDGRLAQMLIATDITARRTAENMAAMHAEKAQVTSRLVTMGEMASSVAHELNQPLTAIVNYCNGMITRVKADNIDTDTMVAALEKTAKQAQRAGQIIHRIRSFVKRSEPQRQTSRVEDIVDEALELAHIELRRRNVSIDTRIQPSLPPLMVDPLLIEQVLLNLIKNAAESVDIGQMPFARRLIKLQVQRITYPEEGDVIAFRVNDRGPGIKDEVLNRLYEAFFSTKAEGLGIGLSLCRTIIESHQGRIRAENTYNEGAVSGCEFMFTLPVKVPTDLSLTAEGH
jgi:PAS domain S-box-containing protein